MNVITIQSEAFKQILETLDNIQLKLAQFSDKNPLEDKWLDNQDVCLLLNISNRTLQTYRDKGILPYSQIGAKIYYKASDIDLFLNQNYKEVEKKKRTTLI